MCLALFTVAALSKKLVVILTALLTDPSDNQYRFLEYRRMQAAHCQYAPKVI